jgi:hypothetical protein
MQLIAASVMLQAMGFYQSWQSLEVSKDKLMGSPNVQILASLKNIFAGFCHQSIIKSLLMVPIRQNDLHLQPQNKIIAYNIISY